jgi:hypothetical protein
MTRALASLVGLALAVTGASAQWIPLDMVNGKGSPMLPWPKTGSPTFLFGSMPRPAGQSA